MKKHLIIPDSHAHPDYDNERYEWLGKLILDEKPDVVVDIGDWFDMASLCSYDKGTKSFEGRRYSADVSVGVDAQDRLLAEVRRAKKKLPRFVRTLGNHEHRINRAIEFDPILEGTISMSDLQSKEYKWEEFPFKEVVTVDGIDYSHYFASGVMGNSVGGMHQAHTILSKRHRSSTQGHAHTFDYKQHISGDGRNLHGLVVGCYIDYTPEWTGPQVQDMWWRGVVICDNVENGDYDLRKISLKSLVREYGSRKAKRTHL